MNMQQSCFWASILLGAVLASCAPKQKEVPAEQLALKIVPKPVSVQAGEGYFEVTPETKIYLTNESPDLQKAADYLQNLFAQAAGFRPAIEQTDAPDTQMGIILTTQGAEAGLGNEGYTLEATAERVVIRGGAASGVFYGVQTLRQMLPNAIESKTPVQGVVWSIPAAIIRDSPRFVWRGMHLDVSRHFMPKEFVKQYIDYLAAHKLNVFHFHLTDDQGWRIEIKKYPKLTEVGAWRSETLVGHYSNRPKTFDGKKHGGFYTHEDIREIVAYAADRFITVVPEIEMPGHASAAIAAYPELGSSDKPVEVVKEWGIFPDIFNVEEPTFTFLEEVLAEVIELFPSPYIHVGGDEALKEQWESSPRIKARMKEFGIKDAHELQSYFIQRMEKFINAKGRKLIGWDEILEGGLAPNATVMSWRGEEGGIAAAKSGHDVVMTPTTYVYFDYYQGPSSSEPLAIGGFLPIGKVYGYSPIPAVLTEEEAKHILGVQANIWTEYLPTGKHVEYMAFPRMAAIAEIAWTPQELRQWEDFADRLKRQMNRYQSAGINHAPTVYNTDSVAVFSTKQAQ